MVLENKIPNQPHSIYTKTALILAKTSQIGLIWILFWNVSCNKAPTQTPTLFQILPPEETGIYFNNEITETEKFNIIEYLYFYNGGGVAVGDINNDGLPDLYFSGNQLPNKLYLNKGNLIFEDITENAGVASIGEWKTGVTMVDINGDGLLDIYVCRLGNFKEIEGRNELYINNGDLTFTESAEEYGLAFRGFSTQAAFFDYDGDGDLDMYLLNHAVHTERTYGRASLRYIDDGLYGDKLYKNNSEKGIKRFTNVTYDAGIFSSAIGYGLGVGISDLNGDGWPDIYVSNDFNENDYLYINQGDGTFKESINDAITYTSRFSMGNDLADFNNDGHIDILSVDMLPEDEKAQKKSAGEDSYEIYQLKLNFGFGRQASRNMLHLNNGNGTFSEIAQLSGIHATDWSWSPLFADFDNDGFKDIFISNGILRRPNDLDYINFITNKEIKGGLVQNPDLTNLQLANKMPSGEIPDYFYKNNGDLTFSNTSTVWGINSPSLSNGAVYADLDNDGDLDLVVNQINQVAAIYKNTSNNLQKNEANSYLQIHLKGNSPNVFGIGAKVIAYHGEMIIAQENYTTRGFQSSVSPVLHLGLGKVKVLDSLQVFWPQGKVQTIRNIQVSKILNINQSEANESHFSRDSFPKTLLTENTQTNNLDFLHEENDFNDFNVEFLLPHKLSKEGPATAFADVNGDGLIDFFIGGAQVQPSVLYLQNQSGNFSKAEIPEIQADSLYEDVTAVFFDSNGNGFQDLYVGSAGNIKEPASLPAIDRLYLNNGLGQFTLSKNKLPIISTHSGVVLAGDFDKDGHIDLFVGGRIVPGNYGLAPRSYLLRNLGDGGFEEVTVKNAPGLEALGMVKDAAWVDLDGDGWEDLVIVGEWMPITIFKNTNGQLENKTADYGLENSRGWWNTISIGDLNKDGFPDLIVGNMGLNSRLKADIDNPISLYVEDFDDNGSLDPILTYSIDLKSYPLANRDELVKKIPSLKKKFVKNADFAGKTAEEIFGRSILSTSKKLEVTEFRSMLFLNQYGKRFSSLPLPKEAQFAPIQALLLHDLDGDGHLDIIAGGNNSHSAPYFGAYQGSRGLVLMGLGNGQFNFSPPTSSGLSVTGDIKDISIIRVKNENWVIFSRNDDRLVVYKY